VNKYSITSNEVKLFKHLDKLKDIQNGIVSPVLLHLAPTNKCDMNCVHCCFSERDKKLELNYDKLIQTIIDYNTLGIKSVELTGGGEPTLYPEINELIVFINSLQLALGMNTNALDISRIKKTNWKRFNWVRVALNVFDSQNNNRINKFTDNVLQLKKDANITACYIVPQQIGIDNINKVINFAIDNKIPTRIAPDCLQEKDDIKKMIDILKKCDLNEYIFLSDFNVYLGERENNVCMMHMLKPFLYADGWIYACPSSELAIENNRTMQERYRVCRMEDVHEYYRRKFEVFSFDCSYCKYTLQNNILNAVITETNDNEFA